MTSTDPKPLWVYQLDPEKYSELVMSSSMEGLSRIVHRALTGSGKFPTPTTTAVVAGERGNFSECFLRALRTVRRIDLAARGLFHLLRVRDAVLPFTDAATIVDIDAAITPYVRVTLLAPEVQLADRWPGVDWFLHSDSDESDSGLLPPTIGPVTAAITAAMARHLASKPGEIVVTAFNSYGEPGWTRSLSGTFIVRRRVPAA